MLSVFCDGSSTGSSNNPGGYGWFILRDNVVLASGFGGDPSTTNNRMELQGAIEGLKFLAEKEMLLKKETVELVSDSQYCLKLATGEYKATVNLDLVEELQKIFSLLPVSTRWVKGHQGNRWNEECDKLAKSGKERAASGIFKSGVLAAEVK